MIWKAFYLNTLSISLLSITFQAQALQHLDDQDLRNVNGQDGVYLETSYSEINVDNLYWEDKAGSAISADKVLRANATGISITGNDLGTKIYLDAGSNQTGNTGIDLRLDSHHSLIKVDGFSICDTRTAAVCSPEIGSLALQSTSPIIANLRTTDGLFNANSPAFAEIGLKNMHIYLGQNKYGATGLQNQLLLKNFNFNLNAQGYMYVDNQKGIILETGTAGYADLTRVADTGTFGISNGSYSNGTKPTNSGLNLEFMLKKDVSTSNLYALDPTNEPTGAKGLIRVGANGRLVNGSLQLRGINANGATDTILGNANNTTNISTNSVIGSTGVALKLKTDFTTVGDASLAAQGNRPAGTAATLEIGGAGLNTYGFEFGNLTGLVANTRGTFDSGNIYINLVDTKDISIPSNYTFQNTSFGNGGRLTTIDDYTQNIMGNLPQTYALVTAIRGMHFQTFSRSGRFTNAANINTSNQITETPSTATTASNKWGLALPFYNVDANIAMYGVEVPATGLAYFTADGSKVNLTGTGNAQRLGFSMAMTAQGVDKNFANNNYNGNIGKNTTSILVLDGEGNYYMGLRNIDMLLKGTGTVGTENGSLNFALPNLLIVMAGDVALGSLPTAMSSLCALNCSSFAGNSDAVFGLKLRLGGNMQFSLLPNNSIADGGSLGIVGEFDMTNTTGNTLQMSDLANKSVLGLDNINGKLLFNNRIGISKYTGESHSMSGSTATKGEGTVHFDMGLTFNPDSKNCSATVTQDCAKGVLRVRDVNLYPPAATSGQRLGELAITGGRLQSNLGITPRAGSFSF